MKHNLGACFCLTGLLVASTGACSRSALTEGLRDSRARGDSAIDEIACTSQGPDDVLGEAGTVAGPLQVLSYGVLDAEYSSGLDAIVMVTDLPDQALHIYYPATGVDTRVALPWEAFAVSISPDGVTAAVAHNGHLSYVDLVRGTLIKNCDVLSDAFDIVLAGNGWAYVFPAKGQFCPLLGIKLSDCSQHGTVNNIYAGTVAQLHPSGTRIYGATVVVPDNIECYDISAGAAAYGHASPYHGDYAICYNLWISKDGRRIFTACGNTFRSSDTEGQDMTYNGSLEGVSYIRQLYHASSVGKVLSIGDPFPRYSFSPTNETDVTVRVHDDQFLTLDATLPLPSFPGACGATFVSHGKFVFANNAGSSFYVIVQADPSSKLLNDYAVVTILP